MLRVERRDCIDLVKEIGQVEHLILTTHAYEHKLFVAPFARKFPGCQVRPIMALHSDQRLAADPAVQTRALAHQDVKASEAAAVHRCGRVRGSGASPSTCPCRCATGPPHDTQQSARGADIDAMLSTSRRASTCCLLRWMFVPDAQGRCGACRPLACSPTARCAPGRRTPGLRTWTFGSSRAASPKVVSNPKPSAVVPYTPHLPGTVLESRQVQRWHLADGLTYGSSVFPHPQTRKYDADRPLKG